MQTNLAEWIKSTPVGQEAEEILRTCVHCGFCNATCPTYQLLGDELDGPRGRIYLIKQMVEGNPVTAATQVHLDRCLTCRSCETTCPSGVKYGKLVDIGRALVEEKVGRRAWPRFRRNVLHWALLNRGVFGFALGAGRALRAVLPERMNRSIPSRTEPGPAPVYTAGRHARRMLLLQGCVQPLLLPRIDAAAARVLEHAGIGLVTAAEAGCCGALSHHLDKHEAALAAVRRNIDAWWPHVESGAEAIVITASGCGVMVRDYGHLLRLDPQYADKAARISSLAKDISEVVAAEWGKLAALLPAREDGQAVAFHAPCSLQHGMKLKGGVERMLQDMGCRMTPVADSHLCCGSAGTYSLLQPELSGRLKENKLGALAAGEPQVIASANVGCITHLQSGTDTPVRHWIELLDERLAAGA